MSFFNPHNSIIAVAVSCVLATTCSRTMANPTTTNHDGQQPAATGLCSLDVFENNGTLHLLYGTRGAAGAVPLMYQQSADNGNSWSDPVRVDATLPAANGVRFGMDPQVTAHNDHVLVVWQTAGDGFMGSGPLTAARSDDGGRSWQSAPNPADDNSTSGHGFVDIISDADGQFSLVWLDSRSGQQGLIFSKSVDHGKTWAPNVVVDPETCECCWNSMDMAPNNQLFALYRDKAPRDMALALSSDGGLTWSPAGRVGAFDWALDGCPHVGGGVAAATIEGRTIAHTAVWTGEAEHRGVFYVRLDVDKSSYSAPARLGTPTARNPAIAANASGHVAIVWSDVVENQTVVFLALSYDGGSTWEPPRRISTHGRDATYPKIVEQGDTFQVFWADAHNGHTHWKHYRF